jgi:hypothetical protein
VDIDASSRVSGNENSRQKKARRARAGWKEKAHTAACARYGPRVSRPSTRALVLAASALALASGASIAEAQPPRQETAPRFGALRSLTESPVEVRSELVILDCSEPEPRTLACTVTVRLTLVNPGAEAISLPLLVTVERAEPFHVVPAGDVPPGDVPQLEAPTLRPMETILPPGEERTLELRGHLDMSPSAAPGGFGSAMDGLAARHPLLATGIHHEERRVLYTRPVRRHFASLGSIEVRAHLPEGWSVRTPLPRVTATHDGLDHVLSREPGSDEAHGEATNVELFLEHGAGGDFIRNGGPFIALGATYDFSADRNGAVDFRGRLGYEIGFVDFLILGAMIESDFRRHATVALVLEASTWSMIVPPAVSVGIGGVVRVAGPTGATGGLRLIASALLYSVGFDATFDVFPQDGHWEITLAGRAGL